MGPHVHWGELVWTPWQTVEPAERLGLIDLSAAAIAAFADMQGTGDVEFSSGFPASLPTRPAPAGSSRRQC